MTIGIPKHRKFSGDEKLGSGKHLDLPPLPAGWISRRQEMAERQRRIAEARARNKFAAGGAIGKGWPL